MLLTVTPLYATVLILFYLLLTGRVIFLRRLLRVGLGHSNKDSLQKAIRVHGNFQEYVPLSLFVLLLLELNGSNLYFLHTLGIVLILARILHAIGLYNFMGASVGRSIGSLLNYLVLFTGSLGLCSRLMVFF
jgi:uncharacterized protein